jgi:YfiH family protein
MSLTKLSATAFEGLPGLAHGWFTRQGGVSGGIYAGLNAGLGSKDDPEHVRQNRELVRESLNAGHLLTVHQYHSAEVVHVEQPFDDAAPPKADAMVTDRPGIALGILTADCGPMLFADAEAGVIGAAHAGWGGAFGGVIEATLLAMTDLGASRDRVVVALGPTLAQVSYEVGPEFLERFTDVDALSARFFSQPKKAPRPFFDLPGYVAHRVQAAGIGPERYTDLARDTYAEPDLFYSYRRSVHEHEPDYGRLIAAIMLTGE